jgi:ferredoxin
MPESAETPIISIDRDVCLASGLCLVYAGGTFVHDTEAKAVLVNPVSESIEQIRTAVEACPTGALSLSLDEPGV